MMINKSEAKLPDAEYLYKELLEKIRVGYGAIPFELAGLASGGVWIAERLAKDLGHKNFGVINVSFHRDDYLEKGLKSLKNAECMATQIPFDVNGSTILIIDDVLDTGRTIRAALNELFDYGRPSRVDLAVLADRHRRQLPMDATFKGTNVDISNDQILILEKNHDGIFSFNVETKVHG